MKVNVTVDVTTIVPGFTHLDMNAEWSAGRVASAADEGPPVVEEWTPVEVPGAAAAFAGVDGPIAYRTRVADPRSGTDERAFLELDGVYGRAEAWADGEPLGDHAVPFTPARFEFEPAEGAETELVVVCRPPTSFGGVHATDAVPDAASVPRIRWRADVVARPRTFLEDIRLEPRLSAADEGNGSGDGSEEGIGDEAAIDVTVAVNADAPVDETVTLSLRPEGFRGGGSMERMRLETAAAGRTTATKTVRVRDPSPWWPRELGPQHRYTVRAKLGDRTVSRTTGFRRIERDGDGFLVNGRRVRARGFVRLPRGSDGDGEEADVERALEANATLLRARAHVPSHAFHDACDEAGLLVWQDLPATGPDLPVERGEELATALAAACARHPSVACYGVQDEPVDPFAEPLGSGFLDRLRFRWRAWRTTVDRGPAERVAAAFPDDVPVVPVTGAPGTDPDAAALFPGWRYLEAADVEWLLDRDRALGAAVGAFGAASLVEDVAPGTVPGVHAAAFESRTADPASSRADQARIVKTVAEALRRRGCGVLAAATLRDTAPGGGPGALAADGSEKPVYGALASAYEPVQAVLEGPPGPGSVGVAVVNDTAERVEATLAWAAGEDGGERRVAVEPLATATAGTIDVPADADAISLELSTGDRSVRNRYRL